MKLADSKKIVFGADPDLEIYHDGSNSFISDTGTGDLVIEATHLRLRSKDTVETYILCEQNSSVELYYNNIKKLETTNTGITVTGTINGSISGNAASVTNGIYTTSSVTDLSDVSSVGSGSIITSAERTKLSGIEASAKKLDSLPIASSSTLGGIKVGTNLSIDGDGTTSSVTDTNTTYTVGDGGLTQNNFTDGLNLN